MADKKVKAINYRVPEEFQERIATALLIKKWKLSEFVLAAITQYFNPPEPEVIVEEKIVEVPVEKIIEKEIVKEVVIDTEGTVLKGNPIFISDGLRDALMEIKTNPDASLDAFVTDICWGRVNWAKNKKSNGTQQSQTINSSHEIVGAERPFDYWDRRIAECDEHDYDEQEAIRIGVESETGITDKQRQLLKRGGTRKQRL